MSKQTAKKPFLGIIVAANTRQDAEREFVSVATGKSFAVKTDESGAFEFLTSSESGSMMNPQTGALDLVDTESADLEFVSSSSDEIKAEYTICADGCGSHIISESADAVKHCPRCSCELQSLSEEEIQALSSETLDEEDFDAEVGGIVVSADSLEGALEQYVNLSSSAEGAKYIATTEGDTIMTSESCEMKYNPFNGDESLSAAEAPEEFELTASDENGNIEANYFYCANDNCDSRHVISTSADAIICPSCSSGLIEPEDMDGDQLNVTVSMEDETEESTEVAESSEDEAQDSEDSVSTETEEETDASESSEETTETVAETEEASESTTEEDEMDKGIVAVSSDLNSALEEYVTSVSSEDDNYEARYMMCSNSECSNRHIVSEDELSECPSCSSALVEPENQEGDTLKVTVSLDEEVEEEETSESADDATEEAEESDSGCDEEHESEDDEDMDDEDEESDEDDDSEEDEDEDEEEEDSDSDISVSNSEEEMETLSFDGLELAESADALDPNRFHVCFAGSVGGVPTWLAMCSGIHVASANPISAAKHADLFKSENYGKAVMATAQEHGVEFALREMGFEVVSHNVDVASSVNRKIEKEVTDKVLEVQANAQSELDTISERYEAALATSFVGHDKQVWKGKTNPIKDALISSLSAAGLGNADVLVNRCFETHSEAYIKSAMEKANSLMSLTAQAQNEISEMVKDTNHVTTSSSVESRLSSIASNVEDTSEEEKATQSTSSGKGNYDARLASALGSLGKRQR